MELTPNARDLIEIAPTAMVRRFGTEMVIGAGDRPILDVACGGGRNAILIAYLGGNVICIDKDLSKLAAQSIRLRGTVFAQAFSRITPVALDLIKDEWPFSANSIGGIVNVHFLHTRLFPLFVRSTTHGGHLLLETIQNRGENYRDLPRAGTLRSAFEPSFVLDVYRERRCGPDGHDSVTVQLLGRRR